MKIISFSELVEALGGPTAPPPGAAPPPSFAGAFHAELPLLPPLAGRGGNFLAAPRTLYASHAELAHAGLFVSLQEDLRGRLVVSVDSDRDDLLGQSVWVVLSGADLLRSRVVLTARAGGGCAGKFDFGTLAEVRQLLGDACKWLILPPPSANESANESEAGSGQFASLSEERARAWLREARAFRHPPEGGRPSWALRIAPARPAGRRERRRYEASVQPNFPL
jgi:hypothetical protein